MKLKPLGDRVIIKMMEAEEKTIVALKKLRKPFLVLVNSQKPYSEDAKRVAAEISDGGAGCPDLDTEFIAVLNQLRLIQANLILIRRHHPVSLRTSRNQNFARIPEPLTKPYVS